MALTPGTFRQGAALALPDAIRAFSFAARLFSGQYLVLADRLGRDVRLSGPIQDASPGPSRRHAASQADKPVGEWNHFEITVKGRPSTLCSTEQRSFPVRMFPNLPERGRLAFQHHGSRNKDGEWNSPPSLVQFKNIYIKELPPPAGQRRRMPVRFAALLITGGHEHETSFYTLFDGYKDLARIPVADSGTAFQKDLRDKYDVVIMYDFSRDLDEKEKKHLRDFVESGKGVVVLHHALSIIRNGPGGTKTRSAAAIG